MICNCEMTYKMGRNKRLVGRDGRSFHPTYKLWSGILVRCRHPKNKKHLSAKYLRKSFQISTEWLEDFDSFISDMGQRPSAAHSVDRRDNSKGYCKHNCYWATPFEQSLNRDITKKSKMWPVGVNEREGRYIYRRTIGGHEITFASSGDLNKILKLSEAFQKFESEIIKLGI